jgi:hypothetical protein
MALFAAPLDALAAEDNDSETSVAQTCLNHQMIKRTKVLNDRNILFVTRDNVSYNNQLPRQCPSLGRGTLVNYSIENRRLCNGSSFSVLWRTGSGYVPTFICRLGMFLPVSEDEIADLVASTAKAKEERRARRRSDRDLVKAEPVELPPTAP